MTGTVAALTAASARWRGLVLLRRAVASILEVRRGFHHSDDCARARYRSHPRPPGRRAGPIGLVAWLNLARPESELLRPLPAGNLKVEQVR